MSSLDPAHIVGTGGAIGALCRHFVGERIDADEFPIGTLTVNVVGSFVLGLVTFLSLGNQLALLLGTGACGSFTTFSSFSFETFRLWETGERFRAATNALGNLVGAILAIALAWGVAQLLG